MKTFNVKAGKTMSSFQQNTIVFASAIALAAGRNMLRRGLQMAIFFIAFLGSLPSCAMAQVDAIDISSFYHGVNYATLSGDTMKFVFILGSEDDPAMDVVGFDVAVSFPNLQSQPNQAYSTVQGSWVAAGDANYVTTDSYDTGKKQLTFYYQRSDETGQSGEGQVAKIYLVRAGGFNSSEAVCKLDGGVIMVDNIDMRLGHGIGKPTATASTTTAAASGIDAERATAAAMSNGLVVLPNVATNHLEVLVADADGCELLLTSIHGQVMRRQACKPTQDIDLSGMAAGIYIVTVQSPNRSVSQKVMIR